MKPSDPSTLNVRGYSTQTRPAPTGVRGGAWCVDLAMGWAVFTVLITTLKLPPAPRLWWAPFAILVLVILYFALKATVKRTLGECIWGLRMSPDGADRLWYTAKLTSVHFGWVRVSVGFVATLVLWMGAIQVGSLLLGQNPVWTQAESRNLSAFFPDSEKSPLEAEWSIEPFFYSLGAWPKTFRGKPVFYELPYEKGPPSVFVGHIVARWELPNIRVTFEGPKTPDAVKSGAVTRLQIRNCILSRPATSSLACLDIREESLLRHIREMSALGLSNWELKWLSVNNTALPPEDQVQGIYLSAQNETRGQDRVILITAGGTHQALILDYPVSSAGGFARKIFEQSIRSVRMSDDLGPGRAWVDRQLESIQLDNLKSEKDPTIVAYRMAGIQASLIAKISVNPEVFDSYYHLSGTTLILAKTAAQSHQAEWTAEARPLIQNLWRYGTDISSVGDPRLHQLQDFWLEAQKL